MTQRVALVTGALGGLGTAISQQLALAGHKVVAAYHPEFDKPEEWIKEQEAAGFKDFILVAGDVADLESTAKMVAEAEAKAGPIDILVNNAGAQFVAPVEEFPVEKWDFIIALNLTAAFHTARLAVPHMKQAGWGRIINIASAHSLTASPFKSAYVSAKHGLAGLTKTLALELATFGTTANCISPGYVWTPLVENQIPDTMKTRNMTREEVIRDVMLVRQPTKRFVQPEDIAAMAVFLCREEASNFNGSNVSMDGGWTAE